MKLAIMVGIMKYKVEIERDLCIACGNCVNECEEMFVMIDDKSTLIGGEIDEDNFSIKEYDDISCWVAASEMCPVECIIVFKDGLAIR